jgi:hypothetical protein
MGRQWNTIIESLGPLSSGTGLSINANLTELEALVTTLQADVADGVRANPSTVAIQSEFTSTTNGTIATASTGRLGCTIFNTGPGNLYISLGTTASTSVFTARLNAGDYYEVPFNYNGLIQGIFATAGTAEVTTLS